MKIHFFLFWGALGLKPWVWLMLGQCPTVIQSNRTAELDKIKTQTQRKAERNL